MFINVRDVDEDGRVLKEDFMAKNKNLSIETILVVRLQAKLIWVVVRRA